MQNAPPKDYGTARARSATVSYAEIESAALACLAAGQRPSVQTLRQKIGRGSATTIANALQRFWRDLGVRAQGDPAALTRIPSDIVEAVEAIWQRALTLAAQSAKTDENGAREHLARLRIENEVREKSFELREKEYETAARERERALADSREHLLSTLRMLETDRQTLQARERRITDLESQVEGYRRQLAVLVTKAVDKNRVPVTRPSRPSRPKTATRARHQRKSVTKRKSIKPTMRSRKGRSR
jgi:DNA repair exonuclease SbcCD ATPase subunit